MGTQVQEKQLEFEGMPVRARRFALKSAADLATEKQTFQIGQIVGGQWKGRVVGVTHEQKKDVGIIRKHIIEVEDATIG